MRHLHVLAAIFTLSACMPAEPETTFDEGQSPLHVGSVVVPSGPVTVPLLPSVHSPLLTSQILCDSYQITSRYDDDDGQGDDDQGDDDNGATDIATQCGRTANRLYKEVQVQLVFLTNPLTQNRGLAALSDQSTFLFPDGSYTQGAAAYKTAHPKLFDDKAVVAIQNKFIYKPINRDTVILIGDPTYSLHGGTTVDSVQYHVYTRKHGGEGTCRSLFNLLGKVCWTDVTGEWVYRQAATGNSTAHPVSTARAQIPTAPTYPAALESNRIVCDGSFRRRHGESRTCEDTVREFYKELQFQILTLTNPDTVGSGLATLNEATTFVYPTGLVTEGISALAVYAPLLFGENSAPVGIENKFLYKAIDADTILFIGDPTFTMFNFATGELRSVESVQVSLYRRNATPLGNCRSAANPAGDVCWTEIAEQWVYGQPVRGG